jgi:hypothetical protein
MPRVSLIKTASMPAPGIIYSSIKPTIVAIATKYFQNISQGSCRIVFYLVGFKFRKPQKNMMFGPWGLAGRAAASGEIS